VAQLGWNFLKIVLEGCGSGILATYNYIPLNLAPNHFFGFFGGQLMTNVILSEVR